ncbi:MarR family transcriptional regulator [Paenibacillaceae bacterium]|nr:MarR family transcriptional regulator [Paenibacillaceae bacterium]
MDRKVLFQKFVAFTAAVHQVTNEISKDIKTDNITPVQYSILEYIAVSQPVTISQISDCQHMSMPNTSRELRKLTEKKLCEKTAAEGDKRKQYIRLSAEGEALMKDAFEQIEARFVQRIQSASDQELKEISDALDVLQSKVFH